MWTVAAKVLYFSSSAPFLVFFWGAHDRRQQLSTEPADVDEDTVRSHLTSPYLRVYYLKPNVDIKKTSPLTITLCAACVSNIK